MYVYVKAFICVFLHVFSFVLSSILLFKMYYLTFEYLLCCIDSFIILLLNLYHSYVRHA